MKSQEDRIHREIVQFLQHVEDETGIAISSIFADWVDMSTAEKPKRICTEVRLDTSYKTGG